MFYTGVGARATPPEICEFITEIAKALNTAGYTLRSGGAKGADGAFELGAQNNKEIFYAKDANEEALHIASKFHPAWDNLKPYVKSLHGRNAFQVLGKYLNNPSSFLICWTPDGVTTHAQRTINTGGTGTAISIANYYHVPVHNLKNENTFIKWKNYVEMVNDYLKQTGEKL